MSTCRIALSYGAQILKAGLMSQYKGNGLLKKFDFLLQVKLLSQNECGSRQV